MARTAVQAILLGTKFIAKIKAQPKHSTTISVPQRDAEREIKRLETGVRARKLGRYVEARGLLMSTKRRRLRGPPLMTPRGYVPICVGLENGTTKRFMVRMKLLRDADFSEPLYRSAEEYGFCNEGVLRIPCGAKDFEELMTKRSSKPNVFKVKPI